MSGIEEIKAPSIKADSAATTPSTNGTSTPATSVTGQDNEKPSQESATPSYKSIYTSPPIVNYPYEPSEALGDLGPVSYALELFLASHMVESEDYCNESDVDKERLYFATGYGLIQCIKGLMSYANEDILAGIEHTKHGNLIASQHRKKAAFFTSRLAGYVVSSLNTTGVGFIKSMTDVERHAELVYAESLFEKALLGIVYSGDWLAFIKEAYEDTLYPSSSRAHEFVHSLNMRTTISVYRSLLKFINAMDAESVANGGPAEDPTIDAHFRSGVYLGAGMSTLILSLLPTRLLTVVEMFGYKGDRAEALELLGRAGGWSKDSDEPAISAAQEGVRRAICDMALLIFHLVLSSFTFDGIDVAMAQKIISWNLKRYPDGVFFLFGAGRASLARSQPLRAIGYYTRAMEAQKQYRNLHHISYWEIAIARMALWHIRGSLSAWEILQEEATWSKSIYSYGMAVTLLELAGAIERGEQADESEVSDSNLAKDGKWRTPAQMREEATKLMEKVPELRQKIAGKSIPLEKFVARKARKYILQDRRLALPMLELAYLMLAIAHAPVKVVETTMMAEVNRALAELDKCKNDPKKYHNGKNYWDDYCLAKLMEGVCKRYQAYPDPDADLDADQCASVPREQAAKESEAAFNAVLEHGPKIEFDHQLVYQAHYELGRLQACQGDTTEAKRHFDLVISGKYLEVGPSGRKGRYSLENSLHMRTHAALEALHQKRL
ncbi:hypothetical protein D9757_004042 [Collybiopsis confluens]|uniref:Tetratricopeptide repeat domain 39B n=1 Tax=Collybiopsis confluens TaxID=2823264 RepID=A0A8H5MEM7_9AGAR|nr:hypothetical protein D9757_004042 [Collybiopsis confluens]